MKEKETLKFINAQYVHSDSVQLQGTYDVVKPYLSQGYYIKEDRNGYWLLLRAASIAVILKDSKKARKYYLKDEICHFYGRRRVSENLFETFYDEASRNMIRFFLENGSIILSRSKK